MFTIINKDPEKAWIVCKKCGGAFDARTSGSCGCKNVVAEVDKRGATIISAEDSDELYIDNDK